MYIMMYIVMYMVMYVLMYVTESVAMYIGLSALQSLLVACDLRRMKPCLHP